MTFKDIEGTELKVGDEVYYARKRDYHVNGELIKIKITQIKDEIIYMGNYRSTDPKTQIVKVK